MTFYNQVRDTVAALVMFYSPTNDASMKMMPVVSEVKRRAQGSAQVITVNINDLPTATLDREKIETLPTFAVYRYGRCVWRTAGITTVDVLLDHLDASAYPDPEGELGHHRARAHALA